MPQCMGDKKFLQGQTLQGPAGKNSDTSLKNTVESVPPTSSEGDADDREFWQSGYGEEVPDSEIREINANIANFFRIVVELGRKHGLPLDDENKTSAAVNPLGTLGLSRQSRKSHPASAFPKAPTRRHKKSSSSSGMESL